MYAYESLQLAITDGLEEGWDLTKETKVINEEISAMNEYIRSLKLDKSNPSSARSEGFRITVIQSPKVPLSSKAVLWNFPSEWIHSFLRK
jgi:hypothetical protein